MKAWTRWQCWLALAGVIVLQNCGRSARGNSGDAASARSREIVITTVPLLTKELGTTYPFLRKDFAQGGVLEGKEVYEFMPNTITVNQGDTLRFTFINPEDDAHSFVVRGISLAIPGQSVAHATFVAREAGIFDFVCAVPAHVPMMRGELVILRQERATL